jgi:GNAT superfamily N-acetyltransferase
MNESSVSDVVCRGKRFSIKIDGKEVARAYLYILSNDLHEKPFGFLEDVFVEEGHRRVGCGKKIVERVIEFANEAGCYKLIATSRTEREKVHELYCNLGFVEWGKEFRMDFKDV